MPIDPPVPRSTRSRLADWIEVECLVAPAGVPASRLRRQWAGLEEFGHDAEADSGSGDCVETEIMEEEAVDWENDVAEEMEWRQNTLGPLYPFRFESSITNWKLARVSNQATAAVLAGHSCYLFCLLLSALRDSLIRERPERDLTKVAERHLEQLAASAGAGLLGGRTIHFGSPRSDGTSFRAALAGVGEDLGWKPRRDEPLWSGGQEKDAGVDVIAWRDFADRRPGRLLLFGQAASGRRWTEKAVDPSRLLSWFTEAPTQYLSALFTPFPQHHDCAGRPNERFEDVARSEAWSHEQQCGLVLDRLRIVEMAAEPLARGMPSGMAPTLASVAEWVRRAREAAGP